MFDFGFWELALIAVIALIVVGPDRLPSVARTLGLWFGKARGMMLTLRDEIEREIQLDEVRRIQRETADELKATGEEVRESVAEASDTLAPGPSVSAGQGEAGKDSPSGASGPEAAPAPAAAGAADDLPPPAKPRRTRKPAARTKATPAKRAAGAAKRTRGTTGKGPAKGAKTTKTVKKAARAKAKPTPPPAGAPAGGGQED